MKTAAMIALLAAAIGVTVLRERLYADPNANVPPFLDITSGPALERMTLSYNALAADLYWIRAVQHVGREHAASGSHRYPLLYPMLDLVTTLDPRFYTAYRFGAIFLAEPLPGGAGRPDLAIKLLEKGIAAQPRRWEYFQDAGFIYYWQYGDLQKAAEWYEQGSRVPGAPWWLAHMAGVMLARGGDRASSRFLWQRLLESADNDWLRERAELRLAQLDAMDQIDQLQAAVDRYRSQTGHAPASWDVLWRARILRVQEPADPSGAPYALDAATAKVSLAPSSKLYPLPTEPPGRTGGGA